MSSEASVDTAQDGSAITESEVQVGEFACRLLTTKNDDSWFGTSHVLYLPLAYCEQQKDLFNLTIYTDGGRLHGRVTVNVADDEGTVLFQVESWELQSKFTQYRRGLTTAALRERLVALQERLDEVPLEKKPIGHPVFRCIRQFENELRMYLEWWGRGEKNLLAAQDLLGRIEHEIDRLAKSDPAEVAVEQLFVQSGQSSVHARNLKTVAAINAASVRTGGFIEPFTEDKLIHFYLGVLSGFDNPLGHTTDATLLLDLEEYAPADVLADPDLEAAPLQVAFESNKGEALYDVTYRFVNETPIAVVRLPFKVYQRHAPEYGKPSRFPVLPHGISWAAEVEFDGRVIARGQVDADLNRKVEKWERGKNRSKHREESITMGDLLYGAEASDVPPWYQGKARPGRRK